MLIALILCLFTFAAVGMVMRFQAKANALADERARIRKRLRAIKQRKQLEAEGISVPDHRRKSRRLRDKHR
jgi:hypothetical protein